MAIEPNVTNPSRDRLVTFGSMVITTKMIGPGISGSIPSHSGNLVPYPRSQRMPICHRVSNPGPRLGPFIFIEVTIELDVTNPSREGLVAFGSMVITTLRLT